MTTSTLKLFLLRLLRVGDLIVYNMTLLVTQREFGLSVIEHTLQVS